MKLKQIAEACGVPEDKLIEAHSKALEAIPILNWRNGKNIKKLLKKGKIFTYNDSIAEIKAISKNPTK